MATVLRRKDSQYWCAVWRDAAGRQRWRSTKQTVRAKALADALDYERADKLAGQGDLVEAQARKIISDILERTGSEALRAPSIEAFFKEWMEGKEASKAAATVARYSQVVTGFLAGLGERAKRPLTALTARDIQTYLTRRQKAGCSPTTVQLDGKILRTGLNRARRLALIATNPAEAVELPERDSVERGTFTPAEVKMLVDAANGEWKSLILIGYFTGARLGDCCRLEWGAVDLTKGYLRFTQDKTGKPVVVPLHPELQSHLESLASSDEPAKFVTPGMANKGPGGRHGLSESFKAIVRKSGLDLQTVQGSGRRKISKRTFHALRHSFASGLANAGVTSELRMKLTGHLSESIHRGYTHHEIETLREAVQKLPGLH